MTVLYLYTQLYPRADTLFLSIMHILISFDLTAKIQSKSVHFKTIAGEKILVGRKQITVEHTYYL